MVYKAKIYEPFLYKEIEIDIFDTDHIYRGSRGWMIHHNTIDGYLNLDISEEEKIRLEKIGIEVKE